MKKSTIIKHSIMQHLLVHPVTIVLLAMAYLDLQLCMDFCNTTRTCGLLFFFLSVNNIHNSHKKKIKIINIILLELSKNDAAFRVRFSGKARNLISVFKLKINEKSIQQRVFNIFIYISKT